MKIKPNKAQGPDNIQAWMLRDLAPFIAQPVTAIFNSSIRDGYIPPIWKSAHISPLPKKSPPKKIESDIRPISLTPLLAKELERFVAKWIRQQTAHREDHLQFGNKQNVSTTHLLVNLLHNWAKALDEGKSIEAVFIDFTKAFDKIDHNILMKKYETDNISPFLLKWLSNFLFQRRQSVKIGNVVTDPLTLNGAVPQGAIMGLEAFITMVKDMKSKLPIFKYVDDSTLSYILDRNKENTLLKQALDDILVWTKRNGMCMNPTKTKDMIISGTKEANIPKLTVGDQELERVTSSKLVGLHIQNDLKWDTHVNYIVDS